MSTERYAIGISANNIDFFVGYKTASLYVPAESTVSASATAIRTAQSSVSSSLSINVSGTKIAFSTVSSSGQSSVSIAGSEILHVLLYSDSHLTTSFNAQKIAFSSSTSNGVLSPSFQAEAVKNAIISISVSSSVSASAGKIVQVAVSSSPSTTVNFAAKEVNLAQCAILAKTAIIINPPIKIKPSFIDSSSIRTLMRIDNKPITEHNRKLNTVINPSFIENKNWNNRKNRYYRRSSDSGRTTFEISWSWLPGQREHTVDQRYSRDYLKGVANDPSHHTLEIIEEVENGTTAPVISTYTVFVRSYTEKVIKRDVSNDVYYFECSMTLEEA